VSNKMSALKVANPYSKALFQLALNLYNKDKNKNPDIFFKFIFDIQNLLKLLSEVPELESFLQNPLHSNEIKKEVLNQSLSTKLTPNTMNFLHLLVDKKRIGYIQIIGETFLEKAYDFLCIKFVEVWSSVELSSQQEERLTTKLHDFLGPLFTEPFVQYPTIFLTSRIEKKILGGLVIRVGSKVIDLSLRGDLERVGILA
jgi:F-type H+-transporting ATPase subunit delta